ncbi:hypothetical protein CTRI78_v004125 [Colletotrichum trifolii]|uniref:2EXR domain-containing protein n=1 Tax=Colletotrichum trifolii TaxID=5466 RepID=A0A4R8RHR7_COLTR|nr:hypothetical protein CTRI78_v004125 [Colletotrichum trifolii]
MVTPNTFPQFMDLPIEVRLLIWEEAIAGPAVHAFDVCFPSKEGNERSKRAFQESRSHGLHTLKSRLRRTWWNQYEYVAFLDPVESPQEPVSRPPEKNDPSMHRQRSSLRLSCREAAGCIPARPDNVNTVYLPGRNSKFDYDNDQDLLFLRFPDESAAEALEQYHRAAQRTREIRRASFANGITRALEAHWSLEMARTAWAAKRLAIDAGETVLARLTATEMSFLTARFERSLEALYLVVHPGSDASAARTGKPITADLQYKGELYRKLHRRRLQENVERPPDVFHGVGVTYREIFNFEALPWEEMAYAYIFAWQYTDAVSWRQQINGADTFKGVRVLAREEDLARGD